MDYRVLARVHTYFGGFLESVIYYLAPKLVYDLIIIKIEMSPIRFLKLQYLGTLITSYVYHKQINHSKHPIFKMKMDRLMISLFLRLASKFIFVYALTTYDFGLVAILDRLPILAILGILHFLHKDKVSANLIVIALFSVLGGVLIGSPNLLGFVDKSELDWSGFEILLLIPILDLMSKMILNTEHHSIKKNQCMFMSSLLGYIMLNLCDFKGFQLDDFWVLGIASFLGFLEMRMEYFGIKGENNHALNNIIEGLRISFLVIWKAGEEVYEPQLLNWIGVALTSSAAFFSLIDTSV